LRVANLQNKRSAARSKRSDCLGKTQAKAQKIAATMIVIPGSVVARNPERFIYGFEAPSIKLATLFFSLMRSSSRTYIMWPAP
jgi:hypothetical protein